MIRSSALALLLALSAAKLDGVSLRWKPTAEVGVALNAAARTFKTRKVQVKPLGDAREDKPLIGRNTEDKTPKLVTTKDDVGAWCTAQLSSLLRDSGVAVVDSGADLVVSGSVTRFMVEEDDHYNGAVALKLTVSDADGKELWSGLVNGRSRSFGRSYKEENYMESLSDAFVQAAEAFFSDPQLAR